jgi:hypothetical protein
VIPKGTQYDRTFLTIDWQPTTGITHQRCEKSDD